MTDGNSRLSTKYIVEMFQVLSRKCFRDEVIVYLGVFDSYSVLPAKRSGLLDSHSSGILDELLREAPLPL